MSDHTVPVPPVDVDVLRVEIQKTYTGVSTKPEEEFIFPTGRAWAKDLGYPQPELSRVPDGSVDSFAGVVTAQAVALGGEVGLHPAREFHHCGR